MTREERIFHLKMLKSRITVFDEDDNKQVKALQETIQALEQEPTETWSIKDVADTFERHGLITEQEPKYCDRNICMANECNGIGCDECEVQEPTDENLHREREQAYMQGYEDASKRFRQESCEDVISREEVLLIIDSFKDNYGSLIDLSREVRKMPPVNSQRQTGYWILADEQNKEDVENDNYRFICSECQCSDIHAKGTIVPYCWKCGAKMVEEQERSK